MINVKSRGTAERVNLHIGCLRGVPSLPKHVANMVESR
jgi:hypothetical protein